MADLDDLLNSLRPRRDELIERLAERLTISRGRSSGDDRTAVFIDGLLPDLTAVLPPSPFDEDRAETTNARGRWRLRTSSAQHRLRLGPHTARSTALAAYHGAAPEKGRRVLITDLDAGQVAAFMAWHFEGGAVGPGRSRRTGLRPHLVVSAGVRDEAVGALRAAYTVLLWHLFLLVAAIDRRTVERRRVGVTLDSAILLTPGEIEAFGLQKGPSTRHGGYADDDYFELVT